MQYTPPFTDDVAGVIIYNLYFLVTCLSFSHEDKTTFVAGSEGGGVFKCSTNATKTATSGMRDIIH